MAFILGKKMGKREFNLVYGPCKHDGFKKYYETNETIVWTSKNRSQNMPNVSMSWYSIRNPEPEDSLYVIEPRCVHDMDYNVEFAKKFKYIFTWAVKAFTNTEVANKVIETNHPSNMYAPKIEQLEQVWNKPWNERKDEITFIINKKTSKHPSELYSLRETLLSALPRNFTISCYGQSKMETPHYKGTIPNKPQILKEVKYNVCTENCYDPVFSYNYFTEKMPDAWFSGCVPIYVGCHNIDNLNISTESYIDLRPFLKKIGKNNKINIDGLVNRIKSFTEKDYEKVKISFFKNIKEPNGLYYLLSYDRVFDTMSKTLYEGK